MTDKDYSLDELCVNTIRLLAVDMVEKANSGHPGLPLGAAPMVYTLFSRHLKFDPSNPTWPDRDRFVLSAGHGSALLYSVIHLFGYDISMNDLLAFRQFNSKTPGHPEFGHTPGVEATTGPLGQGEANAVGMAISERALANRFNTGEIEIVNHYTYSLVSDGGLMEGVSAEAASLAGHLKLGKLIYLFDSNKISLDGPISLSYETEDVAKRYESYGWQVLRVADGNTDFESIDRAIIEAKAEKTKPSIIIINTSIGYGSPKQDTSACHGSPLGVEETKTTKKFYKFDPEKHFHIPEKAQSHFTDIVSSKRGLESKWRDNFNRFAKENPDLASEWNRIWLRKVPGTLKLPVYKAGENTGTRHASKKILNALAGEMPEIIGGAADVAMSTLAQLDDLGIFNGTTGSGRNIYFGVREHAMGAIANGMAYHGGLLPFVSTYFTFTDYMRPSIRLAAMCKLPVFYITTHDSIAVGEDGPTHQPIEHLMSLRTIPGLTLFRPADATETIEAWKWALDNLTGPVIFALTRQKVPVLDRNIFASADGTQKGAYVLSDGEKSTPDAIIIATGSEVHVALDAQKILKSKNIDVSVVSMPSWDIFQKQEQSYRDTVLPPEIKNRVSIEAGITMGWEKWIGDNGKSIGINTYGKSAPGDVMMEEYGITAESVVKAVESL